jgi:hypothetical protein
MISWIPEYSPYSFFWGLDLSFCSEIFPWCLSDTCCQ